MKILLAVDGSPCSRAAIESVVSEFRPEHSAVRILHVDEWPKDLATEVAFAQGRTGAEAVLIAYERCRHRAEKLVADTKHRLEAAHFSVATEIRAGDARREILNCAAEWLPDLIVVGSHGRQGVDGFLLGSVSESVVRHANCSVDVVRPAHR